MKALLSLPLFLLAFSVLSRAQDSRGVSKNESANGTTSYKNIYAVVIGISKYQDKDIDLKFADKDAQLFADYLQAAYPGKLKLYDNLRLLVDSVASFDRIQHELTWLGDVCQKGDLGIFYFAGHGGIQITFNGKEAGYLLAYNAKKSNLADGGTILVADLDELINDRISKEKGATSICILDACHAGTSRLFAASNEDINGKFNNEPTGNVIKLLSCFGSQSSKEEDKLCGGEGVFTYYLVKGLFDETGKDTADVEGIRDVRNYLEEEVGAETNHTQIPNATTTNPNAVLKKWAIKNASTQDLQCLLGDRALPVDVLITQRTPVGTETDYLLGKLTDIQKEHYKLFASALAEGRFIEPIRQSAIYYYKMLEEDRVDNAILEQIKAQWKVKFQDYAQSLIVDYVNELHTAKYAAYENAANMLDYCLSYASPGDPGYNNVVSRKIWLECYATNVKILKGITKISQNEATGIRLGLIEKIKHAISIDSSAAYLRNTLGALYEETGRTEAAVAAYTEAKRLAPRWTYPRNNLSNVLTKTEDKIALLDSCILLNPKMYLAYGNLAVQYRFAKNDLDKCEQYLDLAKKICLETGEESDDIAWIYKQYGYLYQAKQMNKEAEANFLKAISIYGDSAGSYRMALADFYSETEDFDKAKKEIERAARINPFDAELYASWGYRSLEMKRSADALAWYKKSIALDSLNDGYENYAAFLYRDMGSYEIDSARKAQLFDSANKAIDAAIRLAPSSNNLAEKASISLNMKDTATALKYFEKCIDNDPKNPFIYYRMSYLYFNRDIDKAKELMLKAISTLQPNENASYYQNMGYLCSKQKEYQQALAYYQKAVSVNPKLTESIVDVALTQSFLGRVDSSIFYSNQAVENELQIQNISRANGIGYFINKIKETNYNFDYYAVAYLYEKNWKLGKKREDLNQAIKWYGYAVNLVYDPALAKLRDIAVRENLPNSKFSAEVDRYAKVLKSHVKMYFLPCLFPDSSKKPVYIYINDYPADTTQVMGEEISRIREIYNARIPDVVLVSFNKLYKIACENKVSFVELCAYALSADTKDDKDKKKDSGSDGQNTDEKKP